MQQEKIYPIPATLMVALTRYLQTKPWAEVNEFMFAITRVCQPIDEAEARAQQIANTTLPLPPGAGGDAQPQPPNGGDGAPRSTKGRRLQLRDVNEPPKEPPKEPA